MATQPQATLSHSEHEAREGALSNVIIDLHLQLDTKKREIAALYTEIAELHAKYAKLEANDHDTY